jgi:hypothetical protein
MVPKMGNEKKKTAGSFMEFHRYSKVIEIPGTGGSLILKCFKKPGGC